MACVTHKGPFAKVTAVHKRFPKKHNEPEEALSLIPITVPIPKAATTLASTKQNWEM